MDKCLYICRMNEEQLIDDNISESLKEVEFFLNDVEKTNKRIRLKKGLNKLIRDFENGK